MAAMPPSNPSAYENNEMCVIASIAKQSETLTGHQWIIIKENNENRDRETTTENNWNVKREWINKYLETIKTQSHENN